VLGAIVVAILKTTATLSKTARDFKDELGGKIDKETGLIKNQLIDLSSNNKHAHAILFKKIELNTQITKEYSNIRDAISKLDGIKAEACHWAPKELSSFLILKADSMRMFFMNILERGFNNISMDQLRAEMQVKISRLKLDGSVITDSNFITFYFEQQHDTNIKNYLSDLSRYKTGKLNNMNEAFLSRSVVFYRHSLEDLLNS